MANYNYEVFKKLCDRAQELVFDAISEDGTFQFMYVCGLDEALIQMTPIEQIFYLANKIYNEQMIHNKKHNLYLDILPQETIHIKRKNYRVDFLILQGMTYFALQEVKFFKIHLSVYHLCVII